MEEEIILFKKIGLEDKRAIDIANNKQLCASLCAVIREAGVEELGTDKTTGSLLCNIATALYPTSALRHRPVLARAIAAKEVSNTNIKESLDYLKKVGNGNLNELEFRSTCGFGVVVSKEDIVSAVASLLATKSEELKEKRYRININFLMHELKNNHVTRWVEGSLARDEIIRQLETILGPKTEEDEKPLPNKPVAKPKATEKPKEKANEGELALEESFESFESLRFPDPKDNTQLTPDILEAHLKRTNGQIRTRFPPEPNGFLHIGHAKSMRLNFGYAKKHGGVCYLRYDDTNPEKEDLEYFRSIEEMVRWLGWDPVEITYTSSYFPKLYELAVELIKLGKAYVCHETKAQMKAGRGSMGKTAVKPSPWRERPVEESLRLFEDMKNGKFKEGEAVLRMKGDMNSSNPNMRDPVAYRVKYASHPKVGTQWCIYPSYDFSHCLVDSLEDITYSLCSLEFESRHESYDWLVNQLGRYRSHVWEFARLKLQYALLSKRKIIPLVKDGTVRGWDDPRLSTLVAFRRKGFTPEAINLFVEKIGVARYSSPNGIPYTFLEQCCRDDLNAKVHRAMVVLYPLRVVLTNVDETEPIKVRNHPNADMGEHTVPLTKVVYIERTDFRLHDEKGYYGLAPGKQVMLKYAYNITCTDVVYDDNGEITELKATLDKGSTNKVKGVLHWVAEGSPRVEVRLYENLFTIPDIEAEDKREKYLNYINPNAETVISDAIADVSLNNVVVYDKFQFERHGYFVVDKDSTPEKKVFNRTVTLKESKEKKSL